MTREQSGLEIGIGRRARRAYGFDEVALVPGGVTLNPDEVDISFAMGDHFRLEIPVWGAAMDGVVDVDFAIAMGRLGGIAVLNLGKVCQVGPPKALYERPASRFVADFIGINNLLEGTVRSAEGSTLRAETAFGVLSAIHDATLRVGDACVICIRPENIALDGRSGGERNHFKGRISFAAYLGNTLRYDVDLGGGVTFKTDIGDPWRHEQIAMGTAVELSCAIGSTLAIPAD